MNGSNYNPSSWLGTISAINKYNYLFDDDIPNTNQNVVWDNRLDYIIKVKHIQGSDILREDEYTYNSGSTVEVRTLNDGSTLTITTQVSTGDCNVEYNIQ